MDSCPSSVTSSIEDEDESMEDYGSQPTESTYSESKHADPKWTAYLLDEEELEEKPRMNICERIRLMDEEEKRLIAEAHSRGFPTIPDDYVPEVVKKPSKEEKRARYQAWSDKMARIKREKEASIAEDKRRARIEYEKYAKIQKDNKTRDYYWKPDPLYALHLKDLGYSKIAIDKALFYVDNKSVQHALEYLKINPNPTELTKEEVMAAGEEVLKRIRPIRPPKCQPFTENLPVVDEMEVENPSQSLLANETEDITRDLLSRGSDTDGDEFKGGCKDAHGACEDARGLKRNHAGEAIKHMATKPNTKLDLPVVHEIIPNHQMIFVINTRLLMDAVTLSLEVGKAAVRMMDKMTCDTDELKRVQEEWIKDGSTMAMYKGNDNAHLYKLHKQAEALGYINFLAECSHYRNVKTPSPTVLGVFADSKRIKRVIIGLERM